MVLSCPKASAGWPVRRAHTAKTHANPEQRGPFGMLGASMLAIITNGIGGMVGNSSMNRGEFSILTRQSLAVSVNFCHRGGLLSG